MRLKCSIAVLTLAGLSGCAVHQEAKTNITANVKTATDLLAEKQKQSMLNVERVAGIYLGDQPIKIRKRDLPQMFDKKFEFAEPSTDLYQLAEMLTSKTGVMTIATEDAITVSAGIVLPQKLQPSATTSTGLASTSALPPAPPQPATASQSSTANSRQIRSVTLQPYSGTLAGFLDMATARFGVSWKYDKGQIIIYALDTQVFTVASIDSTVDVTSRVGNGSSGGSSQSSVAGTTQQSTTAVTSLSPWKSIENNVRSMLTQNGRVVTSPVTNSIIVTDTPTVLDRVSSYLDSENRKLSKRVDLYVKVFSVKTGKGESYGLDWNAINRFVKDAANTGYPLAPGYSVSATSGGNLTFKLSPNSTSPWAGSDLMLKALSTQGDVSELTSAHMSPLNNRPAPIFVGRQIGYLARTSVSTTDNGSTTALEPGSVNGGFTLNLLPSVLDKGRINLRYSMDIASVSLQNVKSGGQEIQIPDIDTRSLFLDTAVQSGETLVIAGFEQDSNALKGNGVLSPRNFLLGGASEASVGKDVLVAVITAYQVDR